MDFAAKRANVPIEVVRGGNVSQEVQRQALSQIKDGSSRTISRAVDKVVKERMQRDYEPHSRLHTPTRLGKGLGVSLLLC